MAYSKERTKTKKHKKEYNSLVSNIINSGRNLNNDNIVISSLIEKFPGMIYLCLNDRSRTMLYVNSGFKDLTGFDPREVILNKSISYEGIIHPEDRKMVREAICEGINEGGKFRTIYRIITKDGREKWVSESGHMSSSDKGTEILEGFITDITEWKEAEEALKDSESRYRNLFEDSPLGVTTLNNRGFITSCNKAILEFTGLSYENIIGRHFSKLSTLNIKDIPRYMKIFSDLMRGIDPGPLFLEWKHKKGETLTGEVRVGLLKKEDKIEGIQVIVRDATQYLKIKKDLRESEEKYRSLYLYMNEGVCLHEIIYDKKKKAVDYIFLEVNDAFERILNLKREEVVGKKATDIFKTASAPYIDMFKKVVKTGKSEIFEVYFAPLDKYLKFSAFSYERGKFATVFSDITMQKKTEKKLQENQKFGQSILINSPNPIMVLSKDMAITYINPATEDLTGFKKEELLGTKPPYPFLINEADNNISKLKRSLEHGIKKIEMPFKNKKGSTFWAEVMAKPVKIDNEENYLLVNLVDITKRKEALEEIKSLSKFPSENPNPVGRLDYEGRILFTNKSFNKSLHSWIEGNEYIPEPLLSITKGMIKEGNYKNKTIDIKIKRKTYVFTISPIKEMGYINLYGRDITDSKVAEEKMMQAYRKIQKAFDDTINTLASIVESRDLYTSGHQKRVSKLATAIANEMKLSKDKINAINIASLIHDIGKICIPASILSKPDMLSEIEYSMLKTHTRVGYDLIKNIDFPWPIADIVLQHHERNNGSGYPQGLKAKDTMVEAKILAVADVVEAMVSHRPYRPALGVDEALKEIRKNKGKLYDAEVVKACVNLFKRKEISLEENV